MTDTAAERPREIADKIVDDAVWLHEIPASAEAERTLKHDIAAALRAAEAEARPLLEALRMIDTIAAEMGHPDTLGFEEARDRILEITMAVLAKARDETEERAA